MSLWRLIGDSSLDGVSNMALDEALLLSLKEISSSDNIKLPIIRFYSWESPVVSLGYSQDYKKFEELSLPIVRRLTGGKAVLHLPQESELTYSIVCPRDSLLYKVGIRESYCLISTVFINAFKKAGLEVDFEKKQCEGSKVLPSNACFASSGIQEVSVNGKKLIGSAQRRYSWGFLQQGSLVISKDVGLYDNVFGSGSSNAFCGLNEFTDITVEEIKSYFLEEFSKHFDTDFERCTYTDEEIMISDFLAENKYSSTSWLKYKIFKNNDKSQI